MTERVIDVFCHWAPAEYLDRALRVSRRPLPWLERAALQPELSDLDTRRRLVDSFEGYQQVPALIPLPLDSLAGAQAAVDLARCANEAAAEATAEFPEQFPGFVAALPLSQPKAMLAEARRAVDSLGACGVQIPTNVAGRPIDGPAMLELYALMAELDRPLWITPARGATPPDYAGESHSRHELWWALGWPFEVSAAMYRLVFAGVLERWPYLKFIAHHAGGLVPMLAGRLGPGLTSHRRRAPAEPAVLAGALHGAPMQSFRKFYADTATSGSAAAIGCALAFYGPERMLFAADGGHEADGILASWQALRDLALSDVDRSAILWRNAARILRLS